MKEAVDIVIVGGGAVGLSLFHALKNITPNVILLESRAKNVLNIQNRVIGLSVSSQKFLHSLSLWDQIQKYCTPIKSVEVTVEKQFGSSVLSAEEQGFPALGYVIGLQQIESILYDRIDAHLKEKIFFEAPLINCHQMNNLWHLTYQC